MKNSTEHLVLASKSLQIPSIKINFPLDIDEGVENTTTKTDKTMSNTQIMKNALMETFTSHDGDKSNQNSQTSNQIIKFEM